MMYAYLRVKEDIRTFIDTFLLKFLDFYRLFKST